MVFSIRAFLYLILSDLILSYLIFFYFVFFNVTGLFLAAVITNTMGGAHRQLFTAIPASGVR